MSDLISRQAAIDAVEHITSSMSVCVNSDECHGMKRMQRQTVIELTNLPPAQPERMTNRQWIDFLSAQFDISRTSAKEMLHRMMQCKKEDNFKKLFNGEGRND